MMQEKEAKTIFDMGGFSKAIIVPTPMGAGFHLHLVRFGKGGMKSSNGSAADGGSSPRSMQPPTRPTALAFAASR